MTTRGGLRQWLTWALSPSASAIAITLLISLLLPILIHFLLYRKTATKEPTLFLLIGPSGAGKTTLQALFATGDTTVTHTSQTPRSALCTLPERIDSREDRYRSDNDTSTRTRPSFVLLDTPGHGKLRQHAMTAITQSPKVGGIIFVVDSASISGTSSLADAADYLHDTLLTIQQNANRSKSSKNNEPIPFLVAANKQDVFTSLPVDHVRRRLEEEIGQLRKRKGSGLLDSGTITDDTTAGSEEDKWLGEYGQEQFTFEEMAEHGVQVTVLGGHSKNDDSDPRACDAWLAWCGDHL